MSVPEAVQLVEVATKATTAYERPDLTARLGRTRERLADPARPGARRRRVQAGQEPAGQLAGVRAVCPVDDDIATSVPTVVRHADTPSVALVRECG